MKAGEVHACASWVDQRHYFEAGKVEYDGRMCHRHLLCRSCAIARGSRELAKFADQFQFSGAGQLRQYVLTVTVKDGADLRERYEHLVRAWRRRLKGTRGGRMQSELALLVGGKYSLEFKRGSGSGTWHPHLHAFVVADQELPVERTFDGRGREVWRWPAFSEEWRKETGDSFVVECHPVRGDGSAEAVMGAACEVFKYAVKVNQLAHGDRLEAFRVLSGRRLLGSFGCFWGLEEMKVDQVKARRQLAEDDLAWSAYLETAYRFVAGVGYTAQAYRLRGAGEVDQRGRGWEMLV